MNREAVSPSLEPDVTPLVKEVSVVRATYYVGRLYNEEVLEILEKEAQYSFDDDDPLLSTSLRRIDLRKIKRAKAAYKLMLGMKPDCHILFMGTKHWQPESGVGARTVLGYGITSSDGGQGPYSFDRSGGWRHRLTIKALKFVDKRHRGMDLDRLGIRKRFPPSRFFADRRGLVDRVLERLRKSPGDGATMQTEEAEPPKRPKPPGSSRRLPRIDLISPLFHSVWDERKQNGNVRGGSTAPRRWSKDLKRIGDRAEEVVFKHLNNTLIGPAKKSLRWRARTGETPGWDIDYKDTTGRRVAVEVKGTGGASFSTIEITGKEWEAACRLGRQFCLYLVARCRSREPVIEVLRNLKQMQANRNILLHPTSFRLELLRR